MVVYKKTALDTPDDGLMRARNMLGKMEINTENKELHPLVTLLQYVQKMHGMNNLKYTRSCINAIVLLRMST